MDTKVAIVELGGKQHLVKEGAKIVVNKITDADGASITLKNILNGETVSAKVISHQLGKKVHGLKFKAKTRYLKRYGHRQSQTTVEILSIHDGIKSRGNVAGAAVPATIGAKSAEKAAVTEKPIAKKAAVKKSAVKKVAATKKIADA